MTRYRAFAWRRLATPWLLVVMLGLAAAGTFSLAQGTGWLLGGLDDVTEPRPDLVAALHAAADEARATQRLPPTGWDEGLARAARHYARELAGRGVLDHGGATPATRTLADRLARAGVPYATYGENLAYVRGASDPVATTVDGWLESPPHRANLLHPPFDRVGFGSATDADGALYIVQVLAAVPWAPSAWDATVRRTEARRVALEVEVGVAPGTNGLVEVDGVAERTVWQSGVTRIERTVPGNGAIPVRLAFRSGDTGPYRLDETGRIEPGGRWHAGEAPRQQLEVVGAGMRTITQERVHVQVTVAGANREVSLLVDGVHRPEAAQGGGRLEIRLAIEAGASVRLALAEPGERPNQLVVRHAVRLTREGDDVRWEPLP